MNKRAIKQGARHSAGDTKAIQDMHDLSAYLGAACGGMSKSLIPPTFILSRIKAVKALGDVSIEVWDIQNAAGILAQVATAIQSEAMQGEHGDVLELVGIAEGICDFICGELAELTQDVTADSNYAPEEGQPEAVTPEVEIPPMEPGGVSEVEAPYVTDEDAPTGTPQQKAIAKREDVSDADKEAAKEEYGDVRFADAKNKKYPIDTPDHIRAAWNYINKEGNAAKYSGGEVATIKRNIVSAWKDKIDKAGPPSAEKAAGLIVSPLVQGLAYDMAKNAKVERSTSGFNLTYIKRLHLPHEEQYFRDVLAVKGSGDGIIRGYMALWGNEDTVDIESDFFTRQTDFWDKSLGLPRALTWDHAQDPATKAAPVIGQIMQFGDDDIGRWYEGQLDRNYKYRKAIDALISQRAVGTSSDSAPQYVIRERTKSGAYWLKQWPLFAAALTVTPCEPRMLDVGSPFWKSIGFDPQVVSLRTEQALDSARLEELTRLHESIRKFSNK